MTKVGAGYGKINGESKKLLLKKVGGLKMPDLFEMMRIANENFSANYLPKCRYCGASVSPQEVKDGSVVVEEFKGFKNYEHLECIKAIKEGYESGAWGE